MLAGCEGCSSASRKANEAAKVKKHEAIAPRLERFAQAHPDRADEIRDILEGWPDRPERQTYAMVQPIMDQFIQENPSEAEDVGRVMRAWLRRLDSFE